MPELSVAAFPVWLTVVCGISLVVAVVCAVAVGIDVARHPQPMAVMNVVWPVTMLFGSVLWVALYRRHRRAAARDEVSDRLSVAVGTTHCGAGCALGDLVAEFSIALIPGLAAVFGLGTLFGERMFAAWVLDFVVAFLLGIVFQYLSIAPMRGLGFWPGIRAALKADTLSITAWQVGMYGLMAVLQLAVLAPLFGGTASVLTPEFWFAMQLAMLAGFCTSYPVNAWLIRKGIKERM